MSPTILIGIFIAVIAFLALNAGAIFFIYKTIKSSKKEDEDTGAPMVQIVLQEMGEMRKVLNSQMGDFQRTMDTKISESSKVVRDSVTFQFGESQKLIKDITKELTEVKEGNKRVSDVATELRVLQDVLKNPKQRGVLGEYFLENVLKNVLPPGSYQMQYKFKNGEIVDAAVIIQEKIIPIDSKFSLENYNRAIGEHDPVEKERLEKMFKSDLKMRIDETSKYIRPDENTMDFAFMFIPSEGIYYDLLINKVGSLKINTEDLINYAFREKRVIIVSPTSFLAYLQTVMQGLKALKIEESAKQIAIHVGELAKHLKAFEQYHEKLGNSLGTVVNHYTSSAKEFKKIDKDVMRITGDKYELAAALPLIDKPIEFDGEE
ncbi:MAG TPA: DNA recombination protein RmuC [Candidatus Paceibacterota bacterium]|nr:DNA recombination protein RmuC [Candidatus Paceibacterota bacterium]